MATRGSLSQQGAPAAPPTAAMDLVDKEYVDTAIGSTVTATTAATQSVTSSVTTVATTANVPVVANARYALIGYVSYNAAAASDIRISLGVPSGFITYGAAGVLASATAATGGTVDYSRLSAGTEYIFGGTGGFVNLRLIGLVSIAATAGSVVFRFAQGTSGTTATTVEHAWLALTRIS